MMNDSAPKPKPPVKKPEAKQEKKPFVRKDHLTHRPFSNEELLEQLRQQTSNKTEGPKSTRRINSKKGSK